MTGKRSSRFVAGNAAFLRSPSFFLMLLAICSGLTGALYAAGQPVTFDFWARLLLAVVVVIFSGLMVVLLVLYRARPQTRYSLAAERLVVRDGVSFLAWFALNNLGWVLAFGTATFLMLALFGPTVWVAVLTSGCCACMVFALIGTWIPSPLKTLGLCWKSSVPEGIPGFFNRADATLVLRQRYTHSVTLDAEHGVLGEIARTLDLARAGGADQAPDLWASGFASFKRELVSRLRFFSVLFCITTVAAILLFVVLPQLELAPGFHKMARFGNPVSQAEAQTKNTKRPDQLAFSQDANKNKKRGEQSKQGNEGKSTPDNKGKDASLENHSENESEPGKNANSANGSQAENQGGEQGDPSGEKEGETDGGGSENDRGSSYQKEQGSQSESANAEGQGETEGGQDENSPGNGESAAQKESDGQGQQSQPGQGNQAGEGQQPGQGSQPGEGENPGKGKGAEGGSGEGGGESKIPSKTHLSSASASEKGSPNGYGLDGDGPQMGGAGDTARAAFPPPGADQIITVELPPLRRQGTPTDKNSDKMTSRDKRGSERANPGDVLNNTGRQRKASDPKEPIQHLPNWIQALFPKTEKQ